MASSADEVLPALPAIKTAALSTPATEAASPSPSPAKDKGEDKEDANAAEEQEPSTPTSEESRLRTPAECPPAPRKPPPAPRILLAKRKAATTFVVGVPRDLSAVFRSMPPKKRIRAS
ncbi:hypothetical protein GUJ93_ZPchr0009g1230 [Zizania palustris]|uniref:Uncharacterized protein n=1 Tax=Zizania palustris TaxID=103762 RepID=A0A8J5S235_ZIZPA|nr:hypothetical protein GUJ93_ZPchr0009g1230 [Zizania palustris]